MKDGPIRRGLKTIARWKYNFELNAWRRSQRMHGGEQFVLGGSCEGCAKCCESPSIRVRWYIWYFFFFRWPFLIWQRVVNGFVLKDRIPQMKTFVFECRHFDVQTRKCDSYDSRPGMCADYPRGLLYQPRPELFEECGYRPIAKNAEKMLAQLEARDLTPEQMDKLRKELYLEI